MRKIIWSFICLIYALPSLAVPPQFVWRVDSFPPRIVFERGFRPRGSNMNLPDHFLSISFHAGTYGLIGATSDFNAARRFAEDILANPNLTAIYLYRVRVTNHFYNAVQSVEEHIDNMSLADRNRLPIYVERLRRGIDDYAWEHEWFSSAAIPRENIEYARRITAVRDPRDGEIALVDVDRLHINNAHYVAEETAANAHAYPIATPAEEPYSPCSSLTSECSDDSFAIRSPFYDQLMGASMDPNCSAPGPSRMKRDAEMCNPNLINVSLRRRKRLFC